jgi:hypothetical protein
MDEQRETVAPQELLDWVTPELIVEDVKSVTQGGGTYPVAGREDVVGSYYTSS